MTTEQGNFSETSASNSTAVMADDQKVVVTKLKNDLELLIEQCSPSGNIDQGRLVQLLDEITALDVNLEILKETKIGVTVQRLKKELGSTPDICQRAADIVAKWKRIATSEFRPSTDSPSPKKAQKRKSKVTDSSNTNGPSDRRRRCSGDDAERNREKPVVPRRRRSISIHSSSSSVDEQAEAEQQSHSVVISRRRLSSTGGDLSPPSATIIREVNDEIRHKSVELIANALRSHNSLDALGNDAKGDAIKIKPDVNTIADGIEAAIFDEFKETDKKYRSKIRSRVSNLMDKQNEGLRQQILTGRISATQVARMTSDDLANETMKRLKRRISRDLEHEHVLPTDVTSAHTDLYSCVECGEKDASYGLVEEAQEGEYAPVVVTLIHCNKCGHRWKTY